MHSKYLIICELMRDYRVEWGQSINSISILTSRTSSLFTTTTLV